ncbi:zinc-ribbon domain-containing protein [Levilactobacillus spicheri]|uniref:Zinc-ribbon domain-containing protein n=1 Tax=Levilactobacillus spicheri TaxID=216463 RepID=A0A0F3RSD9_9LACO|nr:DUF6574 domain-containing protein [Levilactobacillus spicheri]KJW12529.1 hypothetical protein VC81_08580 [Levilactobacillus spicheri]
MNDDTPKFCPHCGQPLAPGAKFCTSCGYQLKTATDAADTPDAANDTQSAPQDQPQPAPESTGARAKRFSGNVFAWWLATIKHPAQPDLQTPVLFGYLALVLEALLPTLIVAVLAHKATNAANQAANLAINLNGIIWRLCLTIFVVVLLALFIYVGIGFGIRRINDPATTFSSYLIRFTSLTNLVIGFGLLGLLISFFLHVDFNGGYGEVGILILLLGLTSLVTTVGYLYSLVADVAQPRLDAFYLLLIGEIALAIGLAIYGGLVGGLIGQALSNTFAQIGDSFSAGW